MRRFARSWAVILLCLVSSADAREALPEPLTLDYALSLADQDHPQLERYRARQDDAAALSTEVEAQNSPRLDLVARMEAIEPSHKSLDDSHNDSSLKLRLQKRLYDFGRTEAALKAADSKRSGSEWDLIDARQKKRIEIMQNYFDVLLSDLLYLRDNEYMTMAFLHWDKAKERQSLGQVSDIDILELESRFQHLFRVRSETENLQRASRARLAISINRPGELSSEFEVPALPGLQRNTQELEVLTAEAMSANPYLKALRARVDTAQHEIKLAQAGDSPVLRGELEAAAYAKATGSRDPLVAALVLEVPLSTGGAVDARVARKRSVLRERQADLAEAERKVQQRVLELWMELRSLKLQQREMESLGTYRELYLDRSRALYELEVKSDLGDAEGRISDFRYQEAKTKYDMAMAWARLDALLGRLVAAGSPVTGEK